jgi:hypothetical protein
MLPSSSRFFYELRTHRADDEPRDGCRREASLLG